MKKRFLYSLLFGVPGFLLAGISALVTGGLALGVLWLFVFGDNPWPPIIETILPVGLVLVFLVTWLAIIAAGFWIGKRLEPTPGLNKSHILLCIGVTVFLSLVTVLFLISN
jgi:hypothetical protein